jgi:hypothetical protein
MTKRKAGITDPANAIITGAGMVAAALPPAMAPKYPTAPPANIMKAMEMMRETLFFFLFMYDE